MDPPPAEFTVICIDNSKRMYLFKHIFKAQLDAIKLYCATSFKCNPNNVVCLYTMSSLQSGILVYPTSDLQQIQRDLQDVRCKGDANFTYALGHACSIFNRSPPNMKRRLLMFVGGLIDLQNGQSKLYGRKLKERGVAINVFNFYLLNIDASLVGHKYHYARNELGTLVATVNDNDNSHIVDVEDVSSILDILSKSMLKKNLYYLEKKAAADDEYVEAPGIQAPRIEYGNLSKITLNEMQPFRNENNKAAAHGKYIEVLNSPSVKPKLGRSTYSEVLLLNSPSVGPKFGRGKYSEVLNSPSVGPKSMGHNGKNKSAADDEYGQAPRIEYGNLSKKTPYLREEKSGKC